MTFGEKLQALRKARGMSQETLAERLDISRQAVSRWETNASLPDTDKVIQLSRLFGVSIDYLLLEDVEQTGREEPETKEEPQAGNSQQAFRRKFRVAVGAVLMALGLAAGVVAVVFTSLYVKEHAWVEKTKVDLSTNLEITTVVTERDATMEAMGTWRGGLLGAGCAALLSGGALLAWEYHRGA